MKHCTKFNINRRYIGRLVCETQRRKCDIRW